MGILQWAVEMGRISVAYAEYEVQLLASYSCAPRKGHMGWKHDLKKHIKFKLVLDHRIRDSMQQIDFKDFDWER